MKHLLVATACALFLSAAPAHAQANRTWVSGTGDDNNGCSRTMPCKTFAGAIPKTAPNGTISVLDPGGYGSLTIGKSINIVADGAQAGVQTLGTTGFTINAGPNDVVTLRGLFFEAVTPPGKGIQILSAGVVVVDHCTIRGYTTAVSLDGVPGTKLYLTDSLIALNDTGVAVNQGAAEVFLDGVRLMRNQIAIANTGNPSAFHLHNSVLAGNKLAIGKVTGRVMSTRTNALLGNGSNGQRMTPEPLQ